MTEQLARKAARGKAYYAALTPQQREQRRARDRELYAANAAHVLARKKADRDANPEIYRERSRAYAKRHPERRKEYREKNREKYRQMAKQAYANNPGKHRQRAKARRQAHPERVREEALRAYGFTIQLKDEALALQGHRCPGCKSDLRGLPTKHVHADHCHRTKRARGVLCRNCNVTLGLIKDNPETLRALAEYLENPTLATADASNQSG